MAGELDPSRDKTSREAREKNSNQRLLNALILAGVFVLGALLPMKYKGFAPFLFLIPVILNVLNKIRQSGEVPPNPSRNPTYHPPMPKQISSHEPYTSKPRDPKDPRRYKPIG